MGTGRRRWESIGGRGGQMVRRRRPAQWRGDRGTAGQRDRVGVKGRAGDPSGDGRGGQGEGSVGDVDGWGTPVGWDRGQRDREKCSKRCPGEGRGAAGCPRGQSVPVTRGRGSFAQGLTAITPMSLPYTPTPAQGVALGRVPMSLSPSACPHPHACVPYTCPCVPMSPCPMHVPMPPCPLPHMCPSAGACMPHACPCVP